MKLLVFEREGKQLLQGIVSAVTPGAPGSSVEGRVANVKLTANVYDREQKREVSQTVSIAFWNSDSKKLADDALRHIQVGKYMSILAVEKDGKYSGRAFKSRGVWKFAATDEVTEDGNIKHVNEANVIIGMVTNAFPSENSVRFSVPITKFDSEGKSTTEWASISAWPQDKNPNFAANAIKVLSPTPIEGAKSLKHTAVFRCGEGTEYTLKKKDANGNSIPALDENGNQILDDNGEIVYEELLDESGNPVKRVSYTAYAFDRIDQVRSNNANNTNATNNDAPATN